MQGKEGFFHTTVYDKAEQEEPGPKQTLWFPGSWPLVLTRASDGRVLLTASLEDPLRTSTCGSGPPPELPAHPFNPPTAQMGTEDNPPAAKKKSK